MARVWSESELLERLRHRVQMVGNQAAAARALHISPQYLADVLAGRRLPGRKLLDNLGLRRIRAYEDVA